MNDRSISVEDVERGRVGLREFLAKQLECAASLDFPGDPKDHPLIVVHSIKNILGDVRDNPPHILLETIEKKVLQYPVREDDSSILDKAASDGLNESVFIMDLWEALLRGDMELAEIEAAQVHLVSDRSVAVFECLCEFALQKIPELGTLAYHLSRAFAFQEDAKKSWPFVRCLLREIGKTDPSEPHDGTDGTPDHFLSSVLSVPRPQLWTDFASMWRMWESDGVRASGYRREISHWFSSFEEFVAPEISDTAPCMLDQYLENDDSFIADLAVEMVNDQDFSKKVTALEGLRALAKMAAPELVPVLADRLKLLCGEKTLLWDQEIEWN